MPAQRIERVQIIRNIRIYKSGTIPTIDIIYIEKKSVIYRKYAIVIFYFRFQFIGTICYVRN